MDARFIIQKAIPQDELGNKICQVRRHGKREFEWIALFAKKNKLKVEGADQAIVFAGGRASIIELISSIPADQKITIRDQFDAPQFLCIDVVRKVRKLHKNLTLAQLRTALAHGFNNDVGKGTRRVQYSDQVSDPPIGSKGKVITVGELAAMLDYMFEHDVVEV